MGVEVQAIVEHVVLDRVADVVHLVVATARVAAVRVAVRRDEHVVEVLVRDELRATVRHRVVLVVVHDGQSLDAVASSSAVVRVVLVVLHVQRLAVVQVSVWLMLDRREPVDHLLDWFDRLVAAVVGGEYALVLFQWCHTELLTGGLVVQLLELVVIDGDQTEELLEVQQHVVVVLVVDAAEEVVQLTELDRVQHLVGDVEAGDRSHRVLRVDQAYSADVAHVQRAEDLFELEDFVTELLVLGVVVLLQILDQLVGGRVVLDHLGHTVHRPVQVVEHRYALSQDEVLDDLVRVLQIFELLLRDELAADHRVTLVVLVQHAHELTMRGAELGHFDHRDDRARLVVDEEEENAGERFGEVLLLDQFGVPAADLRIVVVHQLLLEQWYGDLGSPCGRIA